MMIAALIWFALSALVALPLGAILRRSEDDHDEPPKRVQLRVVV